MPVVEYTTTIDRRLAGDPLDPYNYTKKVRLAASVSVGAATITVDNWPDEAMDGGHWIAIDPYTAECEFRIVTDVAGGVLTLSNVLRYSHAADDLALLVPSGVLDVALFGVAVGAGLDSSAWAANAAGITAALAEATLLSGTVQLPAGVIETNVVSVTVGDNVSIVGCGMGVSILRHMKDTADALLTLIGPTTTVASTTLRATADPSDIALRVNSTTGFSANTHVYLRDTTDVGANGSWPYDARPGIDNGEWCKVSAVDPGNLELDLSVSVQSSQQYPITATQVVEVALAENLTIRDFTIDVPVAETGYNGLNVGYIDNLRIERVEVRRSSSSGINVNYCLHFLVAGCHIWGGEDNYAVGLGYGIQTNASQWGLITGCTIYRQRRTIDLSGNWPTRFVNVAHNMLIGSYASNDRSVTGTHGSAEYCAFIGNTISGGGNTSGVYVRGNQITISGNHFVGVGAGAILLQDGKTHLITGNTLNGMKRWSTGSGASGRWCDRFLTVSGALLTYVMSAGNIVEVNDAHVLYNSVSTTCEIWIEDHVLFNPASVTVTRPILSASAGAVTAHVDCVAKGHTVVGSATGGATITPADRRVVLT